MVDDLKIIPERDESRARTQPTKQGSVKGKKRRPQPPPKAGSSPLVGVLCFMVVLVSGAAAYLFIQTQTLSEQRNDLDARVQVLEQKLSVTDESLSESGAAMQSVLQGHQEELEMHMSEIRKLWGVAYDTNRKNIETLEKNQATQTAQLGSIRDSVAKAEALAGTVQNLNSRVDAAANQSLALSAGFDETESQVRELTDSVGLIRAELNTQKNLVTDHSDAIEAIDQYRVQINQRLIQLENQIRTP